MKKVFHREPNPLKRWAAKQIITFNLGGEEVAMLRLRWWPLVFAIGYATIAGLVIVVESFGRGTPV
jgi:hypothetical protein